MKKYLLVFLFLMVATTASAHIRINIPLARVVSDSTKFRQTNPVNPTVADNPSPCGGIARTANALNLVAGQNLAFEWTETINHPGRFIIQFSPANDLNFWAVTNQLYNAADPGANLTTRTTIQVPNTPCDACTLRLLQQMDDQPGEYYVQCVDIRIAAVAGGPPPAPVNPPAPGTPTGQSTNAAQNEAKPRMSSCARISAFDATNTQTSFDFIFIMLLPLAFMYFFSSLSLRRDPS